MSRKGKKPKVHPARHWEVGRVYVERCCIDGDYIAGVLELRNLAGEYAVYVPWVFEFESEDSGSVKWPVENEEHGDLMQSIAEEMDDAVACGIVEFYHGGGSV